MARVWPWLMLAACSSEGSIEILVTSPDVAVSKVEVFIGVHDQQLEAIRPQEGALADAVWWKRDRSLAMDLQPMEEGGVVFQFIPGGRLGDSIAALVVVGYGEPDDDGRLNPVAVGSQLLWTDIPKDEIHRYDFELVPAQRAPGSVDVPGVQVWGPPARLKTAFMEARDADPHACVQVDNVKELAEYPNSAGAFPRSGMIVDGSDPDCDGLIDRSAPAPDTECIANEYLGQESMTRDTLKCALLTTFVSTTNPSVTAEGCVIGGGTCTDGPGMGPCARSAYCAPTDLCRSCGSDDCDAYNAALGTTPTISCTLYGTDSGAGARDLCPEPAHVHVATLLPMLGLACDSSRPAKLRQSRDAGWATEMPLLFAAGQNSSGTLAVSPMPMGGPCDLRVAGLGQVPTGNTGEPLGEFRVTLSVPFGPTAEGRGLVIPLDIHIAAAPYGQCQELLDCVLKPNSSLQDPGLYACVRAAVLPGTQVTD